MTIDEIRAEKKALEARLQKELLDFSQKTNIQVESIDVCGTAYINGSTRHFSYYATKIQLERL